MFVNNQQITAALGPFKDKSEQQSYSNMLKLFTPMAKPEPGDWLFSQKQKGQAFQDYRLPFINLVTPQRNVIYIQPYAVFDKTFMIRLSNFCEVFYPKMVVKVLSAKNLETQADKLTKRKNIYGDQYLAQDILESMKKYVPKDAYCVMGITLKDLYPGNNWNYVYGWALYKARVGIFSFIRWDEQFAEGQTKQMNWDKILYPSLRTMVHEIGHMFGVHHCIYHYCLMNGYNNIEENYRNPLEFCPVCYRKIVGNLKFDGLARYQGLIKYCENAPIAEIKNQIKLYEALKNLWTKQNKQTEQKKQTVTVKRTFPVSNNNRSKSLAYNAKRR